MGGTPPNRFLVGWNGDTYSVTIAPPRHMSRDDALNLAAWLGVLADPMGDDFDAMLKAIRAT